MELWKVQIKGIYQKGSSAYSAIYQSSFVNLKKNYII